MIRTLEGVIDEQGNVRLLKSLELSRACRALVTVLDERPVPPVAGNTFLSEPALTEDWNRPDEDEAWAHLQRRR